MPRHPVGRHLPERLRALRRRRVAGAVALLAVLGPGLLAGLSDDDPPGITTYSVLGADYGYELIWVVLVSTIALIVFHEVAVRTGVVTGKGLMTLLREHRGPRTAALVVGALVVANFGTLCAEFAGLAAGAQLLTGVGRGIAIPVAGDRGRLARPARELSPGRARPAGAERGLRHLHRRRACSPDPTGARRLAGAVVPTLPAGRDAVLAVVATVGTTLAPWGLAFIQSYAVDKRLSPQRPGLRAGRRRHRRRADRRDRASSSSSPAPPPCIRRASTSTTPATPRSRSSRWPGSPPATCSRSGSSARRCWRSRSSRSRPPTRSPRPAEPCRPRPRVLRARGSSTSATAPCSAGAAVLVLVPGVPIVPLLYLSQALNAVLLLAILPFIRGARLGRAR